jgi:hypothetical protein
MLFSTPFQALAYDKRFLRIGLSCNLKAPRVLGSILGKVVVDNDPRVNRLAYLAPKIEGQRGRARIKDVNVFGIWKSVVNLVKNPSKDQAILSNLSFTRDKIDAWFRHSQVQGSDG